MNIPDNILEPEDAYNGPTDTRYTDYPATMLCGYFDGERKCTEAGVSGTEAGMCPKHGVQVETWELMQNATETRPEYKMDAGELSFACEELSKYLAPMLAEELNYIACQKQFCSMKGTPCTSLHPAS